MSKSRIVKKEQLARDVYKITFDTDDCRFTRPGQFVMIEYEDSVRPYPVCDYDSGRFSIVIKAGIGDGTRLIEAPFGAEVRTLTGLGNGFDVDAVPDGAVLAADGAGVAEMIELARALLIRGKQFRVILGYSSKVNIFMVESYRTICNDIEVLTLDGSNGREGSPADAVRGASYVCAGGSLSMLRQLSEQCERGQFSLSDLMINTSAPEGAFTVPTRAGDTSSVSDGPVYDKNEIRWELLSI